MAANIINHKKNNDADQRDFEGTMYVFEPSQNFVMEIPNQGPQRAINREKLPKDKISFRTWVWQRCPAFFASLTCVSYGLMLGWPSPTYPKLLKPDAPIAINYGEMAMIAGFLMLGMCIGTPVSSKRTVFGPKYGIILGNAIIVIGWILMWQAKTKMWLLGSRIVVGTGNGFAMGQIKIYIREICDDTLTISLTKQINIYVLVGFVMAFAIAPFTGFYTYAFVCVIFASVIFFIQIFLPPTPRELLEANKIQEAKKVLLFLNPDCDTDERTRQIFENKNKIVEELGFTKLMKNPTLRSNFLKLTILGFIAQFSGAPATLVFTQLFFENTSVPYPSYIALLYSVLFFLSSLIGIYESPKYNKKSVLLVSSLSVSLFLALKILVIYFKLNEKYFSHSSVICIFMFIFSHTLGLGNIPITLINDFFPKSYRLFVTKYFICLISMFALISTKIFQILFFDFSIETPLYLFLSVSLFGVFFVVIFIPKEIIPVVENMRFFNVTIVNNFKEAELKIQNKQNLQK